MILGQYLAGVPLAVVEAAIFALISAVAIAMAVVVLQAVHD
jgi:hypothetical protein